VAKKFHLYVNSYFVHRIKCGRMLNSSTFRQIPTSNPEEGVWNYMGLLTSSDLRFEVAKYLKK